MPPTLAAQGTDLSREAIAARKQAHRKTGSSGGYTGRELVGAAAQVFEVAKRHRKTLQNLGALARRSRIQKLTAKADEALLTAASQVRLAEHVPADRGYLHCLSVKQIEQVKREVLALYEQDAGALAVDTHRRLNEQRTRMKTAPR